MTSSIPEPLRAVAGLAAVAIDETRGLPRKLTSLPVVALGAAMQASLRLRQSYASLVARGDELLTQLGGSSDEPPAWARFDEDEVDDAARDGKGERAAGGVGPIGNHRSRFDAQPDDLTELDDLPDHAHAEPDEAGFADFDAFDQPASSTSSGGSAPVPGYDGFSLAQLRGRLRGYDAATIRRLLDYERGGAARPAFLTMLENRLATLDRS